MRFAERVVPLRPKLWITTATAMAVLSYERYRELSPEQAAENYAAEHEGEEDDE